MGYEKQRTRRSHIQCYLEKQKNELKKQIFRMAEFNWAREPEIARDRHRLILMMESVTRLIKRTEPLISICEKIAKKLNDVRPAEENSEQLAQDFLKGKLPNDEFIDKYVELRKEIIKRRLLADCLNTQITLAKKYSSAQATTVEPSNPNRTCPTICG